MKRAIYAGSFDPMTKGHWNVVEQAIKVFDEIIIGIGENPTKKRLFSIPETISIIEESLQLRAWDHIFVEPFDGVLMRFAQTRRCDAVIRGLRQISDFGDEFTQHGVNTRISTIPMVYFICENEFLHVSSSTAKTMASYGERIDWLVDPHVERSMAAKYKEME